jgi:uncharacterized protein
LAWEAAAKPGFFRGSLDEEWIELFDKFHVLVGVSLDGDKFQNDKYRVDKRGLGSYDAVIKAIMNLKTSNPAIFNGILAVVDPEFDAKVALDHLSKLHGNLDFLLPHYNHDTFPRAYYGQALFAKFYLALFDAWLELNDPEIHIRFLESIIRRIYGGNSLYEVMNDEPPSLLTISTNGDIEGVDTLKSNGQDTNKTNLNIHTCALDDPNLARVYESIAQPPLSQICLGCDLFTICKGGYLPHRYSATNGYTNPSVYCEDIKILISGLKERLRRFTKC